MAIGTQDLRFRILAQVLGAKSVQDLNRSVNSLRTSARSVVTALGAVGGALATNQAVQYAKSIIDTADSLRDLSQRTSVSVKDLASFKTAAEQSGTSIESLGTAFSKLNVRITEAAAGNRQAQETFKALGISFKDAEGNARPTADVVKDLADRFSSFRDSPEKAAAAVALFGRSGAEIIPFLNQGSEAISRFSLAIDQDFADRADQFNDTLSEIGVSIRNSAIEGLKDLLPTLQEIASSFRDLFASRSQALGFFEAVGEGARVLSISFVTIVKTIETIADAIITQTRRLRSLVRGESSAIRDSLQEGLNQRQNQRQDQLQQFVNRTARNSLLFGEGTSDEIRARREAETRPGPSSQGTQTAPRISAGSSDEADRIKRELDGARLFREAQERQIALEREKAQSYRLTRKELDELVAVNEVTQQVEQATRRATKEGRQAYVEAGEAIKQQRLELIAFQDQQRQSFGVGAQQALRDYVESVKDVAAQTKQAFTNAFSSLEDAIINFVKTGKLNFRDFANSVISDLIRIAVRQSITGPLAQALFGAFSAGASGGASAGASGGYLGANTTFANGGIMTSRGPVPLKSYATGGIANSPQLALFGEGRTPEAYVPLPDGRRIPVAMKGSAGGGNTSVVVNVNMATGEQSSESQDQTGKQLGSLIAAAVKTQLVQERRPGGLLSAV